MGAVLNDSDDAHERPVTRRPRSLDQQADVTPSPIRPPSPQLPETLLDALWAAIPRLGELAVGTVIDEVPVYRGALGAPVQRIVEHAVHESLTGFIELTRGGADPDASPSIQRLLDFSHGLGQAEARVGRSPEVLLAAFRVGARTVWREWSAIAVAQQVPHDVLAVFAELIFAYLDRMSAAGVAGNTAEQTKLGIARQRHREQLARLLVTGGSDGDLLHAAERADWRPPTTLTAVAVPRGQETAITMIADPRALEVPEDAVTASTRTVTVILVPDVGGGARARFIKSMPPTGCVIGPTRPWTNARSSVRLVLRAMRLELASPGVVNTEHHLPELVLHADPDALADLRETVLAPLETLPASTRDRLTETLRSWLMHHGRRDDIAAELYVHPSTVRYRLGQLRELFGDRLQDPRIAMELTVALAVPTQKTPPPASQS